MSTQTLTPRPVLEVSHDFHSDYSTFSEQLNKHAVQDRVLTGARSLFGLQRNWVSNLSNTASLLYHALKSLPSPLSAVNWCGFYVVDSSQPSRLILGPFQGHVACQAVRIGEGVCGTAFLTKKTQLVPDVSMFPGHIACDSSTKSEIVVPILHHDEVVAVLDIDCTELDGFSKDDQIFLEQLSRLIADSCDF